MTRLGFCSKIETVAVSLRAVTAERREAFGVERGALDTKIAELIAETIVTGNLGAISTTYAEKCLEWRRYAHNGLVK